MNPNGERLSLLAILGPGLAIAVAGIGALDVTATALAGARYRLGILWLPVVVVIFKYALNEGVARWQLATGQTVLEGFAERMHPLFRYALAIYLIVWTPLVFSTLVQISGVAADLVYPLNDLTPGFLGGNRSPRLWSGICLAVTAGLSYWGGYKLFEKVVFCSAATVFGLTVASAMMLFPSHADLWLAFVPADETPVLTAKFVLVLFGGIGGTMSILLYGYWIRDRGRTHSEDEANQRNWLKVSRIDLLVSYGVTLTFATCMIVIVGGASNVERNNLQARAAESNDQLDLKQVLELVSTRAATETGLTGVSLSAFQTAFSIAIFATAASSLLGMLQGGPYMFADVLGIVLRKPADKLHEMTDSRSTTYRRLLAGLAVISIPLIFLRTEDIAMAAMIWGALIIPFLATILLYLNNQTNDMGAMKNGWLSNATLSLFLALFLILVVAYLVNAASQ